MPLANGQMFAGYEILGLLGSGGMGEVYLAQHPRLSRREALKVLPAALTGNREFRQRFEREADIAASLSHPHIVAVHNFGEFAGQLWISMDFVDGQDASKLLGQSGMPVDQVLKIVNAVASALDYAHAHKKSLVHRDVKPANIMLSNDDEQRILLADFGIARSLNETSVMTARGFILGTVAYAAPEQLEGQNLNGRADQYALAATTYHLLTGSLPFPLGRYLNASPPKLVATRLELAALDPILSKALAENPNDRFPKCADFARALTLAADSHDGMEGMLDFLELEPPSPSSQDRPTAARKGPRRSRPRKRWSDVRVALVILLLLLLGPFAIILLLHPLEQDPEKSAATQTPTSAAPSIPFEDVRDFVEGYYADLPARPMAAWAKLDAHCQNQTGQREFLNFWTTIQSVTVLSVRPRDATSVAARLRYVRRNGQTDTEDRWLKVALVNGTLLLDESGRIGAVDDSSPPSVTTTRSIPTTTAQPSPDGFVVPGTRYAFPAHYSQYSLAQERPTDLALNHRFDSLSNLNWTNWGPDGADGAGEETVQTNCDPNCADGARYKNPIQIHASNPQPPPLNSGCPNSVLFYTDVVFTYPVTTPPGMLPGNDHQWTTDNGVSSVHYWDRVPTCET